MYCYFSAGTHVLLFFSWYSCIVIFQLVLMYCYFQLVHMYYYFSAGTHVLSFLASTHVLSFSAGTHVLLFFTWYSCIVIFQLVHMYWNGLCCIAVSHLLLPRCFVWTMWRKAK